jgi:glucuronate isomerase
VSFPRHEYFRRTLCNLIGADIARGDLPSDMAFIGSMVKNICFGNARDYFRLDLASEYSAK